MDDDAEMTRGDAPGPDEPDPFAPLHPGNVRRGSRLAVASVAVIAMAAGIAWFVETPDPELAAACERAEGLPAASELTEPEHARLLADLARRADDRRVDEAVEYVLIGLDGLDAGSDGGMAEGRARSLVERGVSDLQRRCAGIS